MAKLERKLTGKFETVLTYLHDEILKGSVTASYEDGSDYANGETHCAVRVYERYSYLGGNRVSLALTLVGHGTDLFLSAITSGGSQAIMFKVNKWGEEAFLKNLAAILDRLETEGGGVVEH